MIDVQGYKQLTKDKRIKLDALLEAGHKKGEIAKLLGCSRSTVYREIGRGLYERNVDWNFEKHYSADIEIREIENAEKYVGTTKI